MRIIHEHRRGCGKRKAGALYIVSEGSPDGKLPRIVLIEPAIPYEGKHFRGYIYITGDALLTGEPEETWLIGPSLDRAIKEKWVSILGMPLAVRRRFGLGEGLPPSKLGARLARLSAPETERKRYWFNHYMQRLEYHVSDQQGWGIESPAGAAVIELKLAAKQQLSGADILAKCWQIARYTLWNGKLTETQRDVRKALASLMMLIGASRDAAALLRGDWLLAWKGDHK